ncbi:MAG: hypothetical protein N3F09_00180 [Bacteroidia bacterium]|nr:hypothetical protein [Bacteroidia bacterium]
MPDFERDGSDLNVLYKSEYNIGFRIHQRGMGLYYKRLKHITGLRKSFLDISMTTLRHPKEIRMNGTAQERKKFVYGKMNSVFSLEALAGYMNTIGRKPDKSSVEVRYAYAIGGGISFAKPYYYQLIPNKENKDIPNYRPFRENSFTLDSVIGRAPYLVGFDEMKLRPYISAHTNISLDLSPYRNLVKTLQAGIQLNYYPIPLKMMAFQPGEMFMILFSLSFGLGERW